MAVNAIFKGWETDSQVTRYEMHWTGDGAGNPASIEAPPGVVVADGAVGVGDFLITLPTPVTNPQIGSAIEYASIQVSALAPAGTDAKVVITAATGSDRTVRCQYFEAGVPAELTATDFIHMSITTKHSLASQ